MGTRNLTAVVLDGEYRVAQYGQWDGYPSGQGATVLEFLTNWNRPQFEEKLRASAFLTEDEINTINETIKANGQQDTWQKKWPALTRDTGAEILQIIQDSPPGIKLKNSLSFAADSLFCEWAYVLDLDANKLEVYTGFNTDPLIESDRFYSIKGERSNEYYPVRKITEYDLNDLPTVDKMVEDCDPPEDEG